MGRIDPGWVAVGLTLLALVGAFLRWVWPILRRVGHLADDLLGEPARPGVQRRPGLVERVANIETELRPNHGGSLRDAVDRVDRGLRGHVGDPHAHTRRRP